MWRLAVQSLDRWAMKLGCRTVPLDAPPCESQAEVREWIEGGRLFERPARRVHFEFFDEERFRFESPVPPWGTDGRAVPGRLMRCGGGDWRRRPAVILVHGWNGDYCYLYLFRHLARQLNRLGLNALFFELPRHVSRRPRGRAQREGNFISGDVLQMLYLSWQTLCEVDGMAGWLLEEGVPKVGLWGFSLGGWLAGLNITSDTRCEAAALTTPIVRMDRAIEELPFCAGVKAALKGMEVDWWSLNLTSRTPAIEGRKIMLVGGRHDLFVSLDEVGECQRGWGGSELLKYSHGHISILASPAANRATCRWLADALAHD